MLTCLRDYYLQLEEEEVEVEVGWTEHAAQKFIPYIFETVA